MSEQESVPAANGNEESNGKNKEESSGKEIGKVEQETNGKEETKDISDLEYNIIRQVEYYFSDANLGRDKFLHEQLKLDEGWVPLDVLITFNRLAKLSKDVEEIANALHKATTGLLEISDDNKKIRRNPEMPLIEMTEERRKEVMSRTVYAKGFPLTSTLDQLLKFFEDYEKVDNIIMRRYLARDTKERKFKGSIFVTFKTKEQAQQFLEKETKYEDKVLLVLWQQDYIKNKQEEFAARKKNKKPAEQKNEAETKQEEIVLPVGTVLHFTDGHDTMSREDIKQALVALGAEVAYIEFKVGDKEGWVRLSKENTAKEVFEKMKEGKTKIGESEVVFKLLDGEEEKTYLAKTAEEMTKRRQNPSRNKKGNYQNKGRHFGGRKRKGHRDDASAKKTKVDG